jgi:hypothetical protein
MDKAALEMKLREIHKALATEVDEKHFSPLYEDILCWKSWNALHAVTVAYGCDPAYVSLVRECLQNATKRYLGDVA